ncbi:hypothetical protein ACIRPU_42150 [Streptomyces sp. NPDC102259]|uniref:hypothetical protein n=1 Tax=Streptomyces sp. NPDC102259 TaxID=3366148 RepID=UPI00382120E9
MGADNRQVLLRLARQRPAPNRLRPRERAEQTELATQQESPAQVVDETARWWKRIPWVMLGTVISVIVGIGSLAFTGVATFYGALVAQDQLEQSRETAKQASREQAMRVTYWADREQDEPMKLHIMNRSPDPVTNVYLAVEILLKDESNKRLEVPDHMYADRVLLYDVLPSVGPCTELVIDPGALRYGKKPRALPTSQVYIEARWIFFRDRDGMSWRRDDNALEPDEALEEVGRGEISISPVVKGEEDNLEWVTASLAGGPTVQQAASCDRPTSG